MTPPPLRLPDPVREDLEQHRPGLAEETEQLLASHARPCVAITAQRVSKAPLRRGALARLFGGREAEPALGVLASKFGGLPYCEVDEDWSEHSFLGQIDLAEATAVLPPDVVKLNGLLRLDFGMPSNGLRVRWFREPSVSRAIDARPGSVGAWETKLQFALAWTLPEGDALEALWPLREPKWFDYDEFDPPGYNGDGHNEFHRMLGHKTGGLDDHYGFTPPDGCSEDIAEYALLLRLTFDNEADFGWGTNWIYLLVPRADLAAGDLSRVVVTGANS
jgi:hypothetical protein